MTLQGIDQGGQKGNQSFGTDAIGGVPCQEQGLLDLWSVVGCSWALECVLHLRRMVEGLNGIFSSIAGDGDEHIEQESLLSRVKFSVRQCNEYVKAEPRSVRRM